MEELIKIQSELKAPKNKYNSFGKYSYRSCEDILEAVKPLLKKHGCYMTITDDVFVAGDRFYIRATVSLVNKDGKSVIGVGLAREDKSKAGMSESQITGTASSYARKYALNGLFLIDDTKDADTDEYKVESEAKAKKNAPKTQATLMTSGLQSAIDECNAAKNKDELMAVWNNHADLHSDKDFMLAMSTKKKEVV